MVKRTISWMFPLVVSKSSKTEPDDYKFFKRLEAVGTGWRAGLTYMPVCPHVHNAKKCVLKERFCRPFYWLTNLKFPVKCIYADHFRCAYVKDYYYQRLQIGTDQEYPTEASKRRYVMQSHIRGDSQHTDVRMEWDGFLVGYEVVGGSVKEPVTPDKWEINKGQRIEWKLTQPKDWLEVEGKIEPGEIGATQREAGEFKIVSKGVFWEGAQKPYFKEFFYKSDRDTGPLKKDKYVRVVVRGLRLPLLDPETRKKIPGKYEIIWRFMVPEDQVAYALERGMKKDWKPPKGVIPVPPDQRDSEEFKIWKATLTENLAQARFSVIEISWLGPVHVRGQAEREYYLRIDDGSAKVLGFLLTDNPLRVLPVGAMGEGRINKKWLDYEGELSPSTPYNPNKELRAYHKVLELADCNIKESTDETGKTIYDLELKGTELKGNFRLIQEEKGTPTYTLESLSTGHEFVLHKHYGNGIKEHYDLRWKLASDHKQEINIYKDPRRLDVGEKAFARVKDVHEDPETLKLWMVTEGTHLFRLVGPLETYIDCLDSGTLEILGQTEDEITLRVEGQKFKGVFKANRVEGGWEFSRIEDKVQKETSELDMALKKKKLELMEKILKEENQSEDV